MEGAQQKRREIFNQSLFAHCTFFSSPLWGWKNTTQLAKYPRVLYVKPSNIDVYIIKQSKETENRDTLEYPDTDCFRKLDECDQFIALLSHFS